MTDFYVGQKVVKIKYDFGRSDPKCKKDIGDLLVDGQIYEVRWVGTFDFKDEPNSVSLRVVGVNRVTQCRTNPGDVAVDVPWGAVQFRPIQENIVAATVSKGLEVFRKIAADVTAGKKAKTDG